MDRHRWARLTDGMQQPESQVTGWTLTYVSDWASLIGVVIGLAGFAWTIWSVWKSRTAAERAEAAANAARSQLLRVDSIAGLSAVVAGLDDVKRLHRGGAWEGMPERYGTQRRLLISVRTGNASLTDPQRATLQSAINQLSMIEREVEEHLANPAAPAPDVVRLNRVVSKHADNLTKLITELKINGETQ